MAFITTDSFYLPKDEAAELADITGDEDWPDNAKKRARYDALKADMDGCVFLLDIF